MKSPRSENLRYIPLQRAAAPRYRRRTLDDRRVDISAQLRDVCAYDVIFNFNRLLPNLNPFGSTQEGQVTVVNRTPLSDSDVYVKISECLLVNLYIVRYILDRCRGVYIGFWKSCLFALRCNFSI